MRDLGPWFVALLFNENDSVTTRDKGSRRKSAIIIHTYVHRAAAIKNSLNKNDVWITMQVIGPFSVLSQAVNFSRLWEMDARTKAAKLQRGLELLEKYGQTYKVQMWSVASIKPDLVKRFKEKRSQNQISDLPNLQFPMSMKAIASLKMSKKINLK